MYNYYEPFLLDRYATTLQDVYGTAPCVEVGDALADRDAGRARRRRRAPRRAARTPWAGERVEPPTDDYPFPYLQNRTIPSFYRDTLLLMLGASLLLIRVAGARFRSMVRYSDLAFMGAAFLLLETKNVVQFALFFGTTWFVNSLVFAGVLLSVYLAIEVARHVRLPDPRVLYPLLLGLLALSWLVPQEALLSLSPVPRFVAAVVAGLRADLRRQPRVRPALPGGTVGDDGVRRQPPRRHRGRHDRVRLADHRVPVPAGRGGRALRAGLRGDATPLGGVQPLTAG